MTSGWEMQDPTSSAVGGTPTGGRPVKREPAAEALLELGNKPNKADGNEQNNNEEQTLNIQQDQQAGQQQGSNRLDEGQSNDSQQPQQQSHDQHGRDLNEDPSQQDHNSNRSQQQQQQTNDGKGNANDQDIESSLEGQLEIPPSESEMAAAAAAAANLEADQQYHHHHARPEDDDEDNNVEAALMQYVGGEVDSEKKRKATNAFDTSVLTSFHEIMNGQPWDKFINEDLQDSQNAAEYMFSRQHMIPSMSTLPAPPPPQPAASGPERKRKRLNNRANNTANVVDPQLEHMGDTTGIHHAPLPLRQGRTAVHHLPSVHRHTLVGSAAGPSHHQQAHGPPHHQHMAGAPAGPGGPLGHHHPHSQVFDSKDQQLVQQAIMQANVMNDQHAHAHLDLMQPSSLMTLDVGRGGAVKGWAPAAGPVAQHQAPQSSSAAVAAAVAAVGAGAGAGAGGHGRGIMEASEAEGGGAFTKEEIHKLKDFMDRYRTSHGMSREELCMRVWSSERKKDNFWDAVAAVLPHRTRSSVYKHVRRAYHVFSVRGKWTPEEDTQLSTLVDMKGAQWKQIGMMMGRMPEDCRDRWRNYVVCGTQRQQNKWTAEEENSLRRVVHEMLEEDPGADINWTIVSQKMGGARSRIQCRYKWNKISKRGRGVSGRGGGVGTNGSGAGSNVSGAGVVSDGSAGGRMMGRNGGIPRLDMGMSLDDRMTIMQILLEYDDETQVQWDTVASLASKPWTGTEVSSEYYDLKSRVADANERPFRDVVLTILNDLRRQAANSAGSNNNGQAAPPETKVEYWTK